MQLLKGLNAFAVKKIIAKKRQVEECLGKSADSGKWRKSKENVNDYKICHNIEAFELNFCKFIFD
jgi:hypothetical protein